MELTPDIHLVDGVICNVYLLIEPDGVTILDTGLSGAHTRILAALRKLGRAPGDVRRIALTHQHLDHVGGAPALVKATGAEVYAPAGDTPAIEGRAPRETPKGPLALVFRAMFVLQLRPTNVTHQVSDGEILPVFANEGGLRVVSTPGHTVGHVSFYLPARRLLFAGDAYQHSAGKISLSPNMLNHDTPQAMRSLASLRGLDVEASLPGHGAPIMHDANRLIAQAVKD